MRGALRSSMASRQGSAIRRIRSAASVGNTRSHVLGPCETLCSSNRPHVLEGVSASNLSVQKAGLDALIPLRWPWRSSAFITLWNIRRRLCCQLYQKAKMQPVNTEDLIVVCDNRNGLPSHLMLLANSFMLSYNEKKLTSCRERGIYVDTRGNRTTHRGYCPPTWWRQSTPRPGEPVDDEGW
jgi:hypothetical protein